MSRSRSNAAPAGYWPAPQAYIFAAMTLLIGIAIGYLLRGSSASPATSSSTRTAGSSSMSLPGGASGQAFDSTNVQGLLRQLQSRPNDPSLLAQVGNAYYDGQQYPQAIEYYQRALKVRPDDVNIRTDMGTAMWYSGDADGALEQFQQSLKYQPNHAQTLFNMGIVRWQGKNDSKGALDAWEQLLSANPNYSDRQRVLDLIQKVRSGG